MTTRLIKGLATLFDNSRTVKLYNFIITNKPWPSIMKFKKHTYVDHCQNFKDHNLAFRKKWSGSSGIYKITFLPCRLFTYYGSSVDLGSRFKYHYHNTKFEPTFLSVFLAVFGWSCFSVTVVELCDRSNLRRREDWYLTTFQPLLNMLTLSHARTVNKPNAPLSAITRARISASLTGKTHTDQTKALMGLLRSGPLNPYYGKSLPKATLDAAASVTGSSVYAYDAVNFGLVNNTPFRSIRDTAKHMPIGTSTLPRKLDTNVPFKGYYYYTKPQSNKPA